MRLRTWKRTRRAGWLVGALGAASAALLALAGPADAGGPTSVMLVSPGSGEATALYTSSADYRTLAEVTGADVGTQATNPTTTAPAALGDREITATWLMHEVTVWRVDRIYPDAAGGAWIKTHEAVDQKPDLSQGGVWHRSPRPEALGSVLSRLGLLGEYRDLSVSAPDNPLNAAAEPDVSGAGGDTGTAWWPALPGLAAGAAVGCGGTLLVVRLSARRRPHETGPRQYLVDV